MLDSRKIGQVIDKYFDFMDKIGGNSFITELIPEQMMDSAKKSTYEGISYWNAIESTVIDDDIYELEKYFNHKLPKTYIYFLKYRHFIELQLGTYSVRFFKNLPNSLINDTIEEIEDFFSDLVQRNYLPFAALSDHGVLCFDANNLIEGNEYPIVSFDHEDGYEESSTYAVNFEIMFIEFEDHLNNWIKNENNKSDS